MAWNVYAKELYHLGHGYPLWVPEPLPRTSREVEIADLGWVRDGQFVQLLRCKETQAELQPHQVQPENYVPFNPPNLVTSGPIENITQRMLCSRSIKNVAVQGSVGSSVEFQLTQDKAALLMLSSRGQETIIRNTRQIVTYMREHLDSWEELANGVLGLELSREEIFFVCGVTKTAGHWGVAAFSDLRRKGATPVTVTVHFDSGTPDQPKVDYNIVTSGAQPGGRVWHKHSPWRAQESSAPSLPFAPAAVPYTPYGACPLPPTSVLTVASGLTTMSAPSVMYRRINTYASNYSAFDSAESLRSRFTHATSPAMQVRSSSPASFSDSSLSVNSLSGSVFTLESISAEQESSNGPIPLVDETGADQCLFVHYYKAKRRSRLLPLKLVARAGPHQLPRHPDEDPEAPKVLANAENAGSMSHHPPEHEEVFDPVNMVLDYILGNSDAEMAIASDMDLYALFPPDHFPDDIAAALSWVRPPITVDEYGVGILSEQTAPPAAEDVTTAVMDTSQAKKGNSSQRLDVLRVGLPTVGPKPHTMSTSTFLGRDWAPLVTASA
ncbi:uncharacterized protein TRAVEDRAFT_21074 [Trametes versicolor FP-101664 SS1]|uniref:uncharacterized protein n=1 Tax=Trametes versicolor (strain FP-101664) TaxID=717944 RepID=UPI0004621B4F|nr:uncharacterized protein TRAVEDRAFT_21074 [Trametes versicolor FP-101664 SS1]EIW57475.1 hypothetical protein TRAVEDRAFT_21074 [Trametes versicolor FP-101664 SS1]